MSPHHETKVGEDFEEKNPDADAEEIAAAVAADVIDAWEENDPDGETPDAVATFAVYDATEGDDFRASFVCRPRDGIEGTDAERNVEDSITAAIRNKINPLAGFL